MTTPTKTPINVHGYEIIPQVIGVVGWSITFLMSFAFIFIFFVWVFSENKSKDNFHDHI